MRYRIEQRIESLLVTAGRRITLDQDALMIAAATELVESGLVDRLGPHADRTGGLQQLAQAPVGTFRVIQQA
jgi:ABC-type tungstate transport system permease subunit